ncbi:MAG: CDP-diacylglycerol--serine O-phosphatidyltransferase [Polyangiaceae bacterium]|nr:CDP-diacylglycerol--serine O-phosphatidyltransferase [Polyangiaceae bacterium]
MLPRSLPRRVDLGKVLFVLPNAVTLGSVYCGFSAIMLVSRDQPTLENFHSAAVLLVFAMLFDVLDGRIARMTRTQSAFGLQLDSLADVISFGIAPALLVHKWVLHRQPVLGALAAFVFVACGVIRLARFNVQNSDAKTKAPGRYTVGLPIPPAAGILVSLLVVNQWLEGALGDEQYTIPLIAITLALSALMVSTARFRSFKDLRFNRGTKVLVLLGIGSSLIIWIWSRQPQYVLAWLPFLYLVIGLVESAREVAQRLLGWSSPESDPPPTSEHH